MPEMNYNTQYQDLINKLIRSKPNPTIDPLTQMLLSIGGSSALQPTNSPQTNRLGQMFNEGMKTYSTAIDEQNKGMRLWDAQNVDFLRAVLTDETAKAKAEAEVKQRIFENEMKVKDDLRKQQEAEAKAREGSALSDYLKGTFDDISPTINNLTKRDSGQNYPQVPINDISSVIGKMNPTLQQEILKATLPKEPKEYAPHAPSDFTTYLPEEMRKSLEEEAANVGIKIGKKRISIAAAKTIAEAIKRKTEMDEVKIITGIDPITQQPYERRETKGKIKRVAPPFNPKTNSQDNKSYKYLWE